MLSYSKITYTILSLKTKYFCLGNCRMTRVLLIQVTYKTSTSQTRMTPVHLKTLTSVSTSDPVKSLNRVRDLEVPETANSFRLRTVTWPPSPERCPTPHSGLSERRQCLSYKRPWDNPSYLITWRQPSEEAFRSERAPLHLSLTSQSESGDCPASRRAVKCLKKPVSTRYCESKSSRPTSTGGPHPPENSREMGSECC